MKALGNLMAGLLGSYAQRQAGKAQAEYWLRHGPGFKAIAEELTKSNDELRRAAADAYDAAARSEKKNAELQTETRGYLRAVDDLQKVVADLRAQVANAETDGPKRDLEKANDAQAARAMARNTKNDFVEYQKGVINVLAQFDAVMSKNSITKADLETINNVRRQMRAILRRQI